MANENAVLTALGLDVSQYVDGLNTATNATQGFVGLLNSLDEYIRKIPLLGTAWEISGGKIVDSLSDSRVAARDFARVMNTDVSQSLTGTLDQITEVQELIKKRQAFQISDYLEMSSNPFGIFSKLTGAQTPWQKDKEKTLTDLQEKRKFLIESLIPLYQKQEQAQSAIVSGSEKQSEIERLNFDIAQRKLAALKEEETFFGPEKERTDPDLIKRADSYREQRQKEIENFSERERSALEDRSRLLQENNEYMEKSAVSAATMLPIDQAELNLSKAQNDLDEARIINIKEQTDAAESRVKIAQTELDTANRENTLRIEMLKGEEKLSAMRIGGASAYAIKLEEIRQKYLVPLNEAIAHGDTAAVQSISSQQADENLGAQTIYRLSGPQGRSDMRRQARFNARQARITSTQQREAVRAQAAREGGTFGFNPSAEGYNSTPTFGPDARGGVGTGVDQTANGPQSDPQLQSINSTANQILSVLKGGNK